MYIYMYMYIKGNARQMHAPKAASDFKKTELPWVGLEPTTSCILGRCSTNSATKAAQLAESNPKILGTANAGEL